MSKVNPTYCADRCLLWNYEFAAITQGQFCFCSSTKPSTSPVSPDLCSQPCAADGSVNQCGSFNYINVYKTSKHIEDLKLISKNNLNTVFQNSTFGITVKQSPTETNYRINFNDGSGWLPITSGIANIVWSFALPGDYYVTVEASESTNTVTVSIITHTVTVCIITNTIIVCITNIVTVSITNTVTVSITNTVTVSIITYTATVSIANTVTVSIITNTVTVSITNTGTVSIITNAVIVFITHTVTDSIITHTVIVSIIINTLIVSIITSTVIVFIAISIVTLLQLVL